MHVVQCSEVKDSHGTPSLVQDLKFTAYTFKFTKREHSLTVVPKRFRVLVRVLLVCGIKVIKWNSYTFNMSMFICYFVLGVGS